VDDWGLPLKSQEYCAAGLEAVWQNSLRLSPGRKCDSGGDVMGVSGPSGRNGKKSHEMSTQGISCFLESQKYSPE
jgi:hypothetical protein